jgi:AcrR family transcriptional regulator
MNARISPESPPRTQAERTALSDARMLDAAVQLIVERGAEGTTLKEVGELAGYSRGLAGYRFGSKAQLFSFIVRSVGEEWLRELGQAVENKVGKRPIEFVLSIFSGLFPLARTWNSSRS